MAEIDPAQADLTEAQVLTDIAIDLRSRGVRDMADAVFKSALRVRTMEVTLRELYQDAREQAALDHGKRTPAAVVVRLPRAWFGRHAP